MCGPRSYSMEILVTRHVRLSAALAFGVTVSFAPLAASGASIAQEAQKICLERYNAEKAGGTLPDGMAKSKYMSQCTKSIKRNAELEAALNQDAAAQQASTTRGTTTTATSSKPAGAANAFSQN